MENKNKEKPKVEPKQNENADAKKNENEAIKEMGQLNLHGNPYNYNIQLLNIIGEIEGHECLPNTTKTTKYEHILPQLAKSEEDIGVDGVVVLLNTVGGDVEAGLAIAEMLASLTKPVVTLVLGGGHSIGVPLSVSGDYSFIVPTATMIVHPIRMSGMVLGVKHNYEYIDRMQNRIISFTAGHASIDEEEIRKLMFNTTELAKDVGSILVGQEAVEKGLINEVGGIGKALEYLYDLIKIRKESKIEPTS